MLKHSLGSYCTPDDRCSEERCRLRTYKVLGRLRRAYSRDVIECPEQYPHVDQTSPYCCYQLDPKHHDWRNMHVMPQFQVAGKCETLAHGLSQMRLNHSHT